MLILRFRLNKICIQISLLTLLLLTHCALAEEWQWQLSTGQLTLDYQENDRSGLTINGVLNSETGSIPMVALSVVNTFDTVALTGNAWTPYTMLSMSYAKGDTDYDGYLQSGGSLTPYSSRSDNTFLQADFDLGLGYQVNQSLSFTPLVTISHQRWERELQQYTEDFDHTAFLAGANIDWQPSRKIPLILKVQAKAGKIVDSNIDVPKLGLNQNIGHSNISQVGIAGQYDLSKHLSMNVGISRQNWEYEQSDIQNNYQYPDSESEQTLWQLGLGYRF